MVVYPSYGATVLHLADDVVDLVGQVVVGHVSQQLVLDLLEKVAYLLELLYISMVFKEELRPFL